MDLRTKRVSLAQAQKFLGFTAIGRETIIDDTGENWLLHCLRKGMLIANGLFRQWHEGKGYVFLGVEDIPTTVWERYSDEQFAEAVEWEAVDVDPGTKQLDDTYFPPTIAISELQAELTLGGLARARRFGSRGPEPIERNRVISEIQADIAAGPHTLEQLDDIKQDYFALRYRTTRYTFCKAREEVRRLSQTEV